MIRLLLLLFAGVALILLLGQLLLPGIAADRISSRVGRYGKVDSVSVHAWPAVQLLWGSGDSVTVRARSLSLTPAQAAKLIWEARGVDRMDFTAASVRLGPLRLTDARVRKRGSSLSAQAVAGQADVKTALPRGLSVQLIRSEAGQVRVRASGGLFGVGATLQVVAAAREGKLLARPVSFPLERLSLTLFSDPHIYVEGVGATLLDGTPPSYGLTMRARLR
ncbi:MAG TPA: LmeA family phospholipid-binding protein [Solirubrobacteraceae bacterium]|jgi:hypothetical protein|nr:LmeA family phospholipid-binding protein [Solirubrobacteraceae bacterium]